MAASLEYGREVVASGGFYVLTGAAASLERGYEVLSGAGSYTLTGTPANLLRPGSFAVIGLPGAYALTGAAASLERGLEVVAAAGSYVLTGSPVTLIWSAEVPIAPGGQPDGDPVYRRAARKRRPQIFVIVSEAAKKLVEQKGPLRKKRRKLAKIIAEEVLEAAGGLLAPDRLMIELADKTRIVGDSTHRNAHRGLASVAGRPNASYYGCGTDCAATACGSGGRGRFAASLGVMIPELTQLSDAEREVLAFDAERLRNEPAFQMGMKLLDARAIDKLITSDPTDVDAMREAQAYVRAVRELAYVLAVFAKAGSFVPVEAGSQYADNQPIGTA